MDDLGQYLCDAFKQAIRSIPVGERDDIYAFALYQSDYDDSVYFSYNTRTHIATQRLSEDDAADAVWSYAYWLQAPRWNVWCIDEFHVLPDGLTTQDALNNWREEHSTLGSSENDNFDLHEQYKALYQEVARCLHASGAIRQVFGRVLPIVMFDDSEGDDMEEATLAVNPPSALIEYAAHMERRKADWAARP